MLEQILEWDKSLFLLLNGSNSSYLDQVMWLYTGKLIWLPLILALLWVLFKRGWKEAVLAILFIALVATLCDQVSSSIFKPLFQRFRPSQDPDFSPFVKVVNGYRGGRYGFISSHACNSFGLALFASLLFRNRLLSFTIFLWAVLNCYSRVYLGVHYPTDILAGAAVGLTLSYLCYILYLWVHRQLYHTGVYSVKASPYSRDQSPFIPLVVYLLFLLILILSLF